MDAACEVDGFVSESFQCCDLVFHQGSQPRYDEAYPFAHNGRNVEANRCTITYRHETEAIPPFQYVIDYGLLRLPEGFMLPVFFKDIERLLHSWIITVTGITTEFI